MEDWADVPRSAGVWALIPLGYPGRGSAGRSWVGWYLGLFPLELLGRAGWAWAQGTHIRL